MPCDGLCLCSPDLLHSNSLLNQFRDLNCPQEKGKWDVTEINEQLPTQTAYTMPKKSNCLGVSQTEAIIISSQRTIPALGKKCFSNMPCMGLAESVKEAASAVIGTKSVDRLGNFHHLPFGGLMVIPQQAAKPQKHWVERLQIPPDSAAFTAIAHNSFLAAYLHSLVTHSTISYNSL